jgi:hypothetical protein
LDFEAVTGRSRIVEVIRDKIQKLFARK